MTLFSPETIFFTLRKITPVVPDVIQTDQEGTDILLPLVIKIQSGSVHVSWPWITGEMIAFTLLKQTEVEGGENTAGGEGHSSQL